MTAYGIKERKNRLEAEQPMGRLLLFIYGTSAHAIFLGRLGDALDMGGTVLFLVSRAASHVTDAKIVLDGGGLIWLADTRARL
jgi:NAD(P)-dependent dehydrogenase (short-subunit alcohol dehydrogenase family)